jgi:2-polyprenyl-3-methyl-5-hydroxy-6-metoxy-1,4-benzoquinol methylase
MSTRDERSALDTFSEKYAATASEVAAQIEQNVIGAVWGANGYTTVDQADVLGRRLELAPRRRLLDVGSGRGWPALYLAQQSGCAVVCSDMPLDGLRTGATRARAEGIPSSVVAASALALPFAPASFDAILSTDVLC